MPKKKKICKPEKIFEAIEREIFVLGANGRSYNILKSIISYTSFVPVAGLL